MKKTGPLLVMLACAIVIAFITNIGERKAMQVTENVNSFVSDAIIDQKITNISDESKMIYKLVDAGHLVAVMESLEPIDELLQHKYEVEFEELFPNSSIYLGEDLYIAQELSYYSFEDVTDKIIEYINNRNVYTVKAYEVNFADESGVYANFYVKDLDIYEEALNKYLSYFVKADTLPLLLHNQSTSELNTYGVRDVSIEIKQTITTSETYAPSNQVFTTVEQVLNYIEYGDLTEKEYYTVQEFDTVAGVGSKNYGLTATQIMNINSDVISDVNQVLEAGTQLCVTYFRPIIDVVVMKDNLKKEVIYNDDVIYIEDPTIREGQEEIRQKGVPGSQNALYRETWENGILVRGELVSSIVTLQPIQEIVARGTMVIPGVGTGEFRWPTDNPTIICGWGCYVGHRAIDIANTYNRYGNLYAADRGTVEVNSYHSINGNYMIIDHGNGYKSYYGHMNTPGYIEVGKTVDKGDLIGQIGQTGKATGPHVHFFIMENGERRNPCEGFLPCY